MDTATTSAVRAIPWNIYQTWWGSGRDLAEAIRAPVEWLV
jgi:hypothetical protein